MENESGVLDDADFVEQSIHHIFWSLDIKKSMVQFLWFLRNYIPVCRLILERYNLKTGLINTIVVATPEGTEQLESSVTVSAEMRSTIVQMFKQGVPEPYFENNPSANPTAVEFLSSYSASASALLAVPLGSYDNEPGGLVLLAEKGAYSSEHLRLISLVKKPIEIAMNNALQHADNVALKKRLARENKDLHSLLVGKYLGLRKSVGLIGILLPFVLMLGNYFICNGKLMLPSISRYYYSGMHDVFVASLCAISLFLFFYSGYGRRERWAGTLASIFALGVAFFPVPVEGSNIIIGITHYICAALLFLTLSLFALFLFPRKMPGVQKRVTDRIQIACGITMLLCIGAIVLYFIFFLEEESSFVFVAETIALVAFGLSWITEGFDIEYELR
jgi:hypothetical protein